MTNNLVAFLVGVVGGQTICMGLLIVALVRMGDKIEELENGKK